jgi:hypothetical protein
MTNWTRFELELTLYQLELLDAMRRVKNIRNPLKGIQMKVRAIRTSAPPPWKR